MYSFAESLCFMVIKSFRDGNAALGTVPKMIRVTKKPAAPAPCSRAATKRYRELRPTEHTGSNAADHCSQRIKPGEDRSNRSGLLGQHRGKRAFLYAYDQSPVYTKNGFFGCNHSAHTIASFTAKLLLLYHRITLCQDKMTR